MSKIINTRSIGVFLAVLAAVIIGAGVSQLNKGDTSKEDATTPRDRSSKIPLHESSRATANRPKTKRSKSSGSDLTPEIAKSRIEEYFAKTPDLQERAKFACDMIRQLCENGFSEEAFQILDANYGLVRENEILTLFAAADLPNSELLGRIDEVSTYKGDKRLAMKGYLNRFKLDELVRNVSDPEFQAMLSRGNKLSSYSLSAAVADALELAPSKSDGATKIQFLDTSKELVEKGFLRPSDFLAIANESVSEDPFESWKLIQGVIPPGTLISNDDDGADLGESLIAKMVMSDGSKTLNNLLKVEDYRSVNHAITQWTHSDPSGATKWYESNAGRLSPNQNNAVSSAFASTALQSFEFDAARAWAEKVQDPKAKEDMLNRIAKKQEERQAELARTEKQKQEQKNR